MRCCVATPVYLVFTRTSPGSTGLRLLLARRLDLLVEHVDPLEDHRAVLAGQPVERDVGQHGQQPVAAVLLEGVGVAVARLAPAGQPLGPRLAERLAGVQFAAQAEAAAHVLDGGKLAAAGRGPEDEIADALLGSGVGPGQLDQVPHLGGRLVCLALGGEPEPAQLPDAAGRGNPGVVADRPVVAPAQLRAGAPEFLPVSRPCSCTAWASTTYRSRSPPPPWPTLISSKKARSSASISRVTRPRRACRLRGSSSSTSPTRRSRSSSKFR